ncbi:hypothetical protein CEXT_332801 [Caerostris extrusa]|uniref:Uncharacterized protein n=1 Tax=Caerostris extrusa TaxID=172846 RepID=A0AAV4MP61_CAEEX|nr:hypothetical protein CEXT_332801 [Caerostris extrusa]
MSTDFAVILQTHLENFQYSTPSKKANNKTFDTHMTACYKSNSKKKRRWLTFHQKALFILTFSRCHLRLTFNGMKYPGPVFHHITKTARIVDFNRKVFVRGEDRHQ